MKSCPFDKTSLAGCAVVNELMEDSNLVSFGGGVVTKTWLSSLKERDKVFYDQYMFGIGLAKISEHAVITHAPVGEFFKTEESE